MTVGDSSTYEEKSLLSQIEDATGLQNGELEQAINDKRPRLHGRTLTYALAFVAGTGFTLFGCAKSIRYPDQTQPYCVPAMIKELCQPS